MYINGATDDLYQKIAQKLKFSSIRSIRLSTVDSINQKFVKISGYSHFIMHAHIKILA